ncbi:Universal stress protein F [Folsomia candida]|uniref:Universal stress protein F n=1 Tax=Folsomia candida TaxID=158441 RepID=A0A226D0U1_FOLCA|nr:Universal stress protein F [Folsomia candida]
MAPIVLTTKGSKNTGQKKEDPVPDDKNADAVKPATPVILGMGNMLKNISVLTSSVANHDTILENISSIVKGQSESMKVLADNLEKLTNNITVPEPEQFDQFEENDTMTNEDTDSNSDLIANLLSGNSGFDDTLQPEISDELKAILEQNESAEVLGPLLSAKVAAAFMKMPSQLLSKETLQKLKDMYKVPENCKLIGVPKVNSEIWSSLPSLAKSADAKLQFQQQHLSRIIIAQACLADEILKLNKMEGVQADKLLKLTMASTTEFSGICSARSDVTEYLFGDNLEQTLKNAKSSAKIVRSSTSTAVRGRFHPYNKPFSPTNHLNYRGALTSSRGSANFRGQSSYRGFQQRGRGTRWSTPQMRFNSQQQNQQQ